MRTDYFDTLRTLAQPIRAADWVMSLDPMRRLMDALGNPQQRYRTIVVTGSTGKGTMCLRTAEAKQDEGLKVGLYTSPHLNLFRERFAILDKPDLSGAHSRAPLRMISQGEFVEIAQAVFATQYTLDYTYSTFETATALAFCWFAREQVNVAVLEVGIGGRFDAVNIAANELAIFTPIEAEHLAILGGSLESIAWHKAGIIQPNGYAITVPQVPEVMTVLEREAREKNAHLEVMLDNTWTTPQRNLLPGRLEYVYVDGRNLFIDGGHTPNAARHLLDKIRHAASITMVVGMLRDKNVAAYLGTFDLPNVHLIYTRAPGDRALTADELLERYRPTQATVTLEPDLDKALAEIKIAHGSLCVIAGSLRMAAAAREAFGLLSPTDLEESRLTRQIFEGEDYQNKLKND